MNEPTLKTIKRLFALSGNRCAFTGCTLPIVEDSGTPTGIVCHINARSAGGPRYDPRQTSEERHGFENLVVMCGRHSKLIDSEPQNYTVAALRGMKAAHELNGPIELSRSDAQKAEALLQSYHVLHVSAGRDVIVNSPGAMQGTTFNIKTSKTTLNVMPAEGSLGSDPLRRNYVKHLIDRYNDFASKQPGRSTFSFAVIYKSIKKKFKADWERVLLSQFDALVSELQTRIDKTRLGSINRGKGIPNYSTFDEYRQKYAPGRE